MFQNTADGFIDNNYTEIILHTSVWGQLLTRCKHSKSSSTESFNGSSSCLSFKAHTGGWRFSFSIQCTLLQWNLKSQSQVLQNSEIDLEAISSSYPTQEGDSSPSVLISIFAMYMYNFTRKL